MTLHQIRHEARKRPEQEFFLNRLYGAHVSPFFTLVCLRLGLLPDQVTLLGAGFGSAGVLLLFLPLGWWSIVAVACLQLGYILDFSDGQVARATGRTSVAGSYLDWLTHFYIPVGSVFAMTSSVAWTSGSIVFLILGTLAALELSSFAFSCREHVLIAMQRERPELGKTAMFHAALLDDARPTDVLEAPAGAAAETSHRGIPGRTRSGVRAVIGEVLIYPGSVHLLTLAVLADTTVETMFGTPSVIARGVLLSVWAAVFPIHLLLAARRNHGLIRALESRSRGSG